MTEQTAPDFERLYSREKAKVRSLEKLIEGKVLELYEAKEKAELQMQFFNFVAEGLPDALILVSADGKISFVNERFKKISQCDSAETLKKVPALEYFASENRDEVIEIFSKLLSERSVIDAELTFVGNEGKDETPVLASFSSCYTDAEQRERTIVIVLHDQTERKGLEDELMQARKLEAIGVLASGIAHEINTPMQFIQDNADYIGMGFSKVDEFMHFAKEFAKKHSIGLEEEYGESNMKVLGMLKEEIPKAIESIETGSQRVVKIISSLKSFAHPGAQDKEAVCITECLDSTITLTKNQWKLVSELETQLEENLPDVYGDRGELNQVFLNLLVNSADAIRSHMDAGEIEFGKILIRVFKEEEGFITLSVKDNGCGIPPELTDRIFDPFFTTKDVGKGSGQGLSLVRKIIVQNHKGKIQVNSKPGQTEFIIKLPTL